MDGVYAALARVPLFAGTKREDIGVEPLGSLTNSSYKVTMNGESYVLRLPGKGTSEYIDRAAEEHNARIAADAGVNAEVLFFDAGDGLMVSGFVEGATLDKARLNQDPETLALVARALRQVHRFGRAFMLRFDVFTKMDDYLTLLSKLRAPLPEDFGEVKKGAGAIRRALESSPMPLAPCHNDTWPPNFLDAGGRIYVIDWEFSGMNDPMWDLADLSVEARFGPEQDRVMMEAYRGALSVPPALYARLALYKTMSDLLWTLWGMIEHTNGNPADDFRAYALKRLEHCKEQMGDAGFSEHLALVARGPRAARSERPTPSRLPTLQVSPQRSHAPRVAPARRAAGPLASPGRR